VGADVALRHHVGAGPDDLSGDRQFRRRRSPTYRRGQDAHCLRFAV